MTRLERTKQKLTELQCLWTVQMRDRNYAMAQKTKGMIEATQKLITDEEAYLPKRLSEQLPKEVLDKSGLCELLVKTHLAADFFCDCASMLREKMDKMGFADCSLFPNIKRLEKESADYAAIVCHPEFHGLQDFMVENSVLIEKLHKTCDAYMKKKLNIDYSQTF